jgi:hypothetical protein
MPALTFRIPFAKHFVRLVNFALGSFDIRAEMTPKREEQPGHHFGSEAIARASITHTKILACPGCTAPGVFKPRGASWDRWPRCCVEAGDPRLDKPVGDGCPHCGAPRGSSLTIERGEVWNGTI